MLKLGRIRSFHFKDGETESKSERVTFLRARIRANHAYAIVPRALN